MVGQYLIQVGSFADVKEADAQKAKLALLGVESRVEKVTIDNSKTWYRVRIGGFATHEEAQRFAAEARRPPSGSLGAASPSDFRVFASTT